jgi:hypothetical protein
VGHIYRRVTDEAAGIVIEPTRENLVPRIITSNIAVTCAVN